MSDLEERVKLLEEIVAMLRSQPGPTQIPTQPVGIYIVGT